MTDKSNYLSLLDGAQLRNAIAAQEDLKIEALLDAHTDVTVSDLDGRTALHHATSNRKEHLVKTLLQRGAHVSAKVSDSAFIYQIRYDGSYSRREITPCQWITPLHNAAGKGHVGICKLLLDHGADIFAKDFQRFTPIDIATQCGHAEVVKLLLEHGGSTYSDQSECSETPLYWASRDGREEVVRILLEHGAGSEAETHWGRRSIIQAADDRRTGIVKLLEEYGFHTSTVRFCSFSCGQCAAGILA